MSCNMIDLPSSVPSQQDGGYVYVFSPPEESPYLSQEEVDTQRAAPSTFEQRSVSTSSGYLRRSFQRIRNSTRRSKQPQPDHNNVTIVNNETDKSFQKWSYKSPQKVTDDGADANTKLDIPHQKSSSKGPRPASDLVPTSPYLLTFSSSRGDSEEFNLSTFPIESPLIATEEKEKEKDVAHSPARKVWGLFQWNKKKQSKTFHNQGSLPPLKLDQHRGQRQHLSNVDRNPFNRDINLYDAGVCGENVDSNDDNEPSMRRSAPFDGSDSFAIDVAGVSDEVRPNAITVEVEVHDVDTSFSELNSESVTQHDTATASINCSQNKSTQRSFLSLPNRSSQKSQKRKRLLGFGNKGEKSKLQKEHQKSHGEVQETLKVPLLSDHDNEQNSCGESEDGVCRLSTVQTSSFITDDCPTSPVMVDCLSDDFVTKLEKNYKKDHLLREATVEVKEAVADTVRQGQVRY